MRRFGLWGLGASVEETKVWLDTGFREMQTGEAIGDGERPDVVFGPLKQEREQWGEKITRLLPKVIVLLSPVSANFPQDLPEDYCRHCWQKAGLYFLVATSLEPRLAEPEWDAYGGEDGLNACQALKAVSDQIYRHLLADVFRETQEWCGHTFSVVIHG